MYRKHAFPLPQLVAAAALAMAASIASADDSSMSVLTGDSYAFFNGLDYNPGKFNTARAQRTDGESAVAKTTRTAPGTAAVTRSALAGRSVRVMTRSPFRDDTGA